MNSLTSLREGAANVTDQLCKLATQQDAPATAPLKVAALIADVSGFTALTASLEAKHGTRGADILSAMMDKLLGGLGEIAESRGGMVVDLIGDAIHAFWIMGEGVSRGDACKAAIGAAGEMLDFASTTTDAQSLTPIRIGISCGEAEVSVVGGRGGRWEPLALGPALVRAGDAVNRAPTSACLIIGDEHWDSIADDAGAQLDQAGRWLLRRPPVALDRVTRNTLGTANALAAIAWTAELRFVTVMFCRLVGAEDMAKAGINRIHTLTRAAQQVIESHGGLLDKMHADDKGISMVIAFGLQSNVDMERAAGGSSALRAVVAAIELRGVLEGLGVSAAMGIATGKVRVGVGDVMRGSGHTMYGNAVNFAARCMQACDNEILCDYATRTASVEAIAFSETESRQLKGLDKSVPVFAVDGILEDRETELVSDMPEIAGRHHERSVLVEFLEESSENRARVLILDGEDGCGKSRLAGYAIEQAAKRDIRTIVCRAGLLGTRTPLFAWRDPLGTLLRRWALSRNLTLAEAQNELILKAGGSSKDASFVGALFGRDGAAPTGADSEADPGERRRLRASVAAALLGDGPRLIVIEDGQWLDDISLSLARDLVRLQPALLLLVVARSPLTTGMTKIGGSEPSKTKRITLSNLDRAATAELAAALLGPFDSKHPFVDWLHARSAGNPMFCRALIALLPENIKTTALRAPGAWRQAQVALEGDDIPATIEGALLERFSHLPVGQLGLLKAASVVGGTFTPATLISLGTPSTADQIAVDLLALTEGAILARSGSAENPAWRFSDELTREVIYASLPKQLLIELHRRAAEFLEDPAHGTGVGRAAEIAHHWLEADLPARAFAPLRQAGLDARLAGAYGSAVALWKTALELIENGSAGVRSQGWFRRAVLQRDLAFASWRLGEPEQTIAHCYDSMEGLWRGAPTTRFGWMTMLASETLKLGWQILLPKWLSGSPRSTRTRAQEWLRLNNAVRLIECFYFSRGALPAAAIAVYAARTAERLGEVAYAARPYGFLGYLAGARKQDLVARFCFSRPRRDCLAKKDWSSLAQSIHGETMYLLTHGRWRRALRRARFVRTLASKISDNADTGNATTLMGLGYLMAGSFDKMQEAFEQVEAVAYAKSNDHYLVFSRETFGQLALVHGSPESAEPLLESAKQLADRVRDLQSSLISQGLLLNAKLRLGKIDEVAALSAALIDQAEATPMVNFGSWYGFAAAAEALTGLYAAKGPGPDGVFKIAATRAVALLNRFAKRFPVALSATALVSGQLEYLNGHPKRAIKLWQRGVRAAETVRMNYDLARLHHVLGRMTIFDAAQRSEHQRKAALLMAICDVRSVPPFALSVSS